MENSMADDPPPPPFSSSINMNDEQITTDDDDDDDDSPEESSWTFYMQDFFSGNTSNIDNININSLSPSSDLCDHRHHHHQAVSDAVSSSGIKNNSRQLSLKRRKPNNNVGGGTGRCSSSVNDLDLEDTATSPANSPKVSFNIQHSFHHQNGQKNNIDATEGFNGRNNITSADHEVVSTIDQEQEENNNLEESELKKKGLCLVPVSMLRNYLV